MRTLFALVSFLVVARIAAAQITRPDDAPRPLSPVESAKHFRLPAGFSLELVASEPLIHEPSGVCWDERGRLFVCELHGYNLEGQYDVDQLNKTGQLDRVVRRLQADEKAKQAALAETKGTVKLLTDTDGDGQMDHAEVWADDLPPCYGICPARGGVIVACAPDVVYLADRDGDGKVDVRETLLTGFRTGALERAVNCPQWGPDHWIYFGRGPGGSSITGPRLGAPLSLPNTDFRMRPDGSAVEPVTGGTHTIGFTFAPSGERFVVTTRTPALQIAPISWHDMARNPFAVAPILEHNTSPDQIVFPTSRPHPWRLKRSTDPEFAKFYTDRYGLAESAPNGYWTSGCAPLIYQDSALPEMHGRLLACEPAQNFVYCADLVRDGLRYHVRRLPGEERREFLASSDSWFHPIALSHAPDGAIWIVDFYREIIEDYSAIPRYLQQQYGLVNGRDRGRIWRLSHTQAPASPAADMSRLGSDELVGELGSQRFWRRQTARRLLIERGAKAEADALRKLLAADAPPAATLEALAVLEALTILSPADVRAALAHVNAGVRIRGLRLAETRLDDSDAPATERIVSLADDVDPRVRLQATLSLAAIGGDRAVDAWARLAREADREPWLSAAVVAASAESADRLIGRLQDSPSTESAASASALLQALAGVIGARHDDAQVGRLLTTVADASGASTSTPLLQGLLEGLKRRRPEPLQDTAGIAALARLLSSPSPAVGARALQIAGLVRLPDSEALRRAWDQAARAALDVERAPTERAAAAELLSAAPYAVRSRLNILLDIRQPVEVQAAALGALAAGDDPEVAGDLTACLDQVSPDMRRAALDALCGRRSRHAPLLDLIAGGKLAAAELSTLQRTPLLELADDEARARAAKLLTSDVTDAQRQAVLDKFVAALRNTRDPARGKVVFEQQCAKCHKLGDLGFAVGPDLNAVKTRPDESLLLDVLEPSKTVHPDYRLVTVATDEGRIIVGILAAESAGGLTLRREQGVTETVLRSAIDEVQISAKSMMPEGMEKVVSPQDLADLLSFLRADSKPAGKATR